MKLWRPVTPTLMGVLALGAVGYHSSEFNGVTSTNPLKFRLVGQSDAQICEVTAPEALTTVGAKRLEVASYRLHAGQSRFMVRAFSGGPLWFKGHDHLIAVRDLSGEVQLTPGATPPASLQMTIRADRLAETRDVFTEPQKQVINKELREIVLETAKYPEITFKSTDVTGQLTGGQFNVEIGGDLTLHGVTRHIVIPADVTLSGDILRARGEFTVDRDDYSVRATSAVHGLVRVRDKLKIMFDIAARQI